MKSLSKNKAKIQNDKMHEKFKITPFWIDLKMEFYLKVFLNLSLRI